MTTLIAGGYAEAGAQGLYPLTLGDDLAVGAPVAPLVNVSAGVDAGNGRWLFVDEAAGCVRLVDAADDWRQHAAVASGGDAPCHLALNPVRRLLAVANYGSGSVALFRLGADAAPIPPLAVFQGQGNGPVADRQEAPHAHWVGFARDGRLYATDLGADRVHVFDPDTDPELRTPVSWAAPPGSGPRQIAFHSHLPIAYLVSELASTLTLLRLDAGAITAGVVLSTLPPGTSDSLVGAVAIDPAGTRLYVSNRGHDSIATFLLDAAGEPTLAGHVPSGGRSPRFLLLADDILLAAHEKSGGVTALRLDADGIPRSPQRRADVPGAAFLGAMA